MSDNPEKKKAKSRAKRRGPSKDAAPTEQGGVANEGGLGGIKPGQFKEDAPQSNSQDAGPWPFALGPEPDTSVPPSTGGGEDDSDQTFDPQVRRQLVLIKHGHRYVFRYERGEETKVLSGLIDLARDPQNELDWFDAAVLSYQMGRRLETELDKIAVFATD